MSKEFELNVLMHASPLANEALGFMLSKQDGVFYMVTDNYFTKSEVTKGMTIGNNQGMMFEGGLEKFIQKSINDSNCLGIVPLTENAYGLVTEKYGLKPILTSPTMQPENVKFSLYGKN